jgi:hypothetical protein
MLDDRRLSEERKMTTGNRSMTKLAMLVLAALAAMAIFGSTSASAVEPGFTNFEVTPSNSQAGGHPDVLIDLEWRVDDFECEVDCLVGRRQYVHWPEGFIGNPHVTPKCTLTEFNTGRCPVDSQIGRFILYGLFEEGLYVPMYNMQTNPKQAGLLGFTAPLLGLPIFLELTSRTDSDYGLEAISSPQIRIPFNHIAVELWGTPADEVHDELRFYTPLIGFGGCAERPGEKGCEPGSPYGSPTFAPSTSPPAPFLQNPTTCGVPLEITGEIEYWGGAVDHASYPWPATTGCNQASFTPTVTAKPTTESTDTATGLDTVLEVPQTQSPVTPAPSEVKSTRVTLPEGFSINPGAADGKVACPESLTAIGTLDAASCPEHAKIGTLMLNVSALPAPIPGALYLAEPKPGEPYRVLLAASGFATNVKLLGRAETDPQTGQVSVVFPHLPQSPLQTFDLHIFGSERGLLATPTHCGTFTVDSEFVPWNTALLTRHATSAITIDSGPNGSPCVYPGQARPFAPVQEAGVANNTAGSHATLNVMVKRADGDQNLTGLSVQTPPGIAASLKGVPYCPESALAQLQDPTYSGVVEQAAPACPAASQIGTANTGAGAGSHPLYVPGKVYLAGPYKGAPLSLVTVIPAVSGPYDLGNVAVRATISIDPVTAQVTTVSDPLPQILEGIPLRTRSILISLDRPDFALNPTNCSAFSVNSSLSGSEGGSSEASSHFQVANCSDLPYKPRLSLKLTGGVKRRGHPAITANFTAQPGEANTKRVQVALPKGELLDNAHINAICTRPAFASDSCPAGAQLGTAEATTPLLDAPLKGNVYLRANPNRELPDMVMDLEGQFDIELAGHIDTVKGGALRTTFATVPDAPVSSFTLRLAGGKKGLLVNSKSLCGKKPRRANTRMVGQNGAIVDSKTKLQAACGGKARHKRHKRGGVR